MTNAGEQAPLTILSDLALVPSDRPVVLLLRHSIRESLPPDGVGYMLPITEAGRGLATELGQNLRGNVRTLHSSPLLRCMQTAEALAEGAHANFSIVSDRRLGDPGVYVIDDKLAWSNWESLGHDGVMRHLANEANALPGMAKPDDAAHILLQHMFDSAGDRPGMHIFITHDLLVVATISRLRGRPLEVESWPDFLDGAFFWKEQAALRTAYRGMA